MRLDQVRLGRASRLDRIRVDGPLAENPVAIKEVFCRQDSFLYLYKLFADGPTLCLRIVQAAKCFEKFRLSAIDKEAPGTELREGAFDEFRLAFPHQAGINVDSKHAFGPERAKAKRVGYGG